MRIKMYQRILLCSLPLLFLIACTNRDVHHPPTDNQTNVQLINHNAETEDQLNQAVMQEFDQINELTSITYHDEILMAIHVNQLAQFSEQKIAEHVEVFIKQHYPNMEAKVSSDFKIFLELNRLKKQLGKDSLTQADFKKSFEHIKQLTKLPED